MTTLKAIATELRRVNARLDKMREELRAQATPTHALKRAEAARAMGVSVSKLDALVRDGKVKTADDTHLIPMAEVKRYCAPKAKRQRRPAIGHRARMKHVDAQSDEAIDALKARLRGRAAP